MIIFNLTFGQFAMVMIISLVVIAMTIFLTEFEPLTKALFGFVEMLLTVCVILAIGWFNTHTASGLRNLKDVKSEYNNGLEREIIIQKSDGEEIYRYEGKIDIESDHTDNYIKFEDEEGKRQIIYYGITDRVFVKEK